MGYNIGCPTIKLTRANSFGKGKDKHHGNYKAIPLECLSERYSDDPDLDRTKTKDNLYFNDFYPDGLHLNGKFVNANFTSGEEVANYWNELADNYTYKTKDGKTKKLRSDAVISFGGIFKPEKAMLDTMSDDEKTEFFKLSIGIICDLYTRYGLTMDYVVLHKDEQQWHLHYGGHDDNYQLSDKIGLKLWKKLNRNVPMVLRNKGYDVNDLVQYDPAKNLTKEELIEYKAKHKERKKRSGRSSRKYKAEKTIETLKVQEESEKAVLSSLMGQISACKQELEDLPTEEEIEALKAQKEALTADVQTLTAEVQKLQASQHKESVNLVRTQYQRQQEERKPKYDITAEVVAKQKNKQDSKQLGM